SILAWRDEKVRNNISPRTAHAPAESLRVREPGIVPDVLSAELNGLADRLTVLAETISTDEEKVELQAAALRCQAVAHSLKSWLEQGLGGQVYWLDVSGERTPRIMLASAPIEVWPELQRAAVNEVPREVITSATS